MANYYAACRSNYFRVKSPAAFEDWCNSFDSVVFERQDAENMYMIYMDDADGCGWPTYRYPDDPGSEEEDTELDLTAELSEFLFEGQVAILEEIGSEKLRYLHGSSIAVNHRGETIEVNLNDMYKLIPQTWPDADSPTEASY